MSEIFHFTKRFPKHVSVIRAEESDIGSSSLIDLIDWLHEQLDEIPHEFREEARYEFNTVYHSDQPFTEICISYYRPETNEEVEARVAQDKVLSEVVKKKELEMLEKLEAKYRKSE